MTVTIARLSDYNFMKLESKGSFFTLKKKEKCEGKGQEKLVMLVDIKGKGDKGWNVGHDLKVLDH